MTLLASCSSEMEVAQRVWWFIESFLKVPFNNLNQGCLLLL